ncbi:MAG: hypothetical protein H0T62_01165 [Parachlamydiaceae bacterium]|nr:hypothetical protein [Parachlamydiaceae bacterium]
MNPIISNSLVNSLGSNFPFNQPMLLDLPEVAYMLIDNSGKSALEIFNGSYFKCHYQNQKYLVTRFLANEHVDLPFNKPMILNATELMKYNINLCGKSTLK